MAVVQIDWNPTAGRLRLFIWLQVAFCALVSLIVYGRTQSALAAAILLSTSITLALVGTRFPEIARVVYIVWMALLFPVAWTVSHVLLLLIYFGLFVPIGLAMKLAGRDPMQRKLDRDAESYWIPRNQEDDDANYFKQY